MDCLKVKMFFPLFLSYQILNIRKISIHQFLSSAMKSRYSRFIIVSLGIEVILDVKHGPLYSGGRRPLQMNEELYQLQFQLPNIMSKRQSWSSEEDKLISSLISLCEAGNKKIKWAEISISLKKYNPEWNRTGKQCRQRWLNHLRPCLAKNENMDQIDLQQLFTLIRVHGKKWSLIAKELPGRTDNTIKNFFYAALRKGLRNLNFYNAEVRSQRRYKVFKQDLIDKLLSVHDQKKCQDLFISDSSVYDLAEKIREDFIRSSFDELKKSSQQTLGLENFYEDLNQNVMQFCRICKFKKSKGKKCDDEGEKFEIFSRKINKKLVKLESSLESHFNKSQSTQQRQIKLEEDLQLEYMVQASFQSFQNNGQMVEEIYCEELKSSSSSWSSHKALELSMVVDKEKGELERSLFQLLSSPEGLFSQEIAFSY